MELDQVPKPSWIWNCPTSVRRSVCTERMLGILSLIQKLYISVERNQVSNKVLIKMLHIEGRLPSRSASFVQCDTSWKNIGHILPMKLRMLRLFAKLALFLWIISYEGLMMSDFFPEFNECKTNKWRHLSKFVSAPSKICLWSRSAIEKYCC